MKSFAAIIVVVAAACGSSAPPAAAPPPSNAVPAAPAAPVARQPGQYSEDPKAAFGQMRDEACACTDTSCEQALTERMSKWSSAHAGMTERKLTPAETQAMTEVALQLSQCMTKVMTPSAPAGSGDAM